MKSHRTPADWCADCRTGANESRHFQATQATLSPGAVAGISVGASVLLFLLCGACVALFCWLRTSEEESPNQRQKKTSSHSINIVTNVSTERPVLLLSSQGSRRRSSKKSGRKSAQKAGSAVEEEKPLLGLKKRSSLRKASKKSVKMSGGTVRKPPLVLKKRSSYRNGALSGNEPPGASPLGAMRGGSPKSVKRSSLGSKKGSLVSKKASLLSQSPYSSKKGSFASQRSSFVPKKVTLVRKKASAGRLKASFVSKNTGPAISQRSSIEAIKSPKPW